MNETSNVFEVHRLGIPQHDIYHASSSYYIMTISCYFEQGVDYAAMAQSKEFLAYVKHTAELQRVKLEGMTREDTLAFFINIYNALVIHANVVRGPPVSLWQRYKVMIPE